jgi:hypothetical protein
VPDREAPSDALVTTDATQLFCDRAQAARGNFSLTAENAAAVAQLCRRLDGIPLAIELAAARIPALTPQDLVDRLDQRFKLLTRGSRAALERHQTLRNTIDWSYDLLNPAEQDALNRMSVFAGGCDLAAAEAVLARPELDGAIIDIVGQLVDKSLVDVDDSSDSTRYRMLETIRQYAQDRLEDRGDTEAARRRHADYYVSLAEAAGPHLRTREVRTWARIVARETDNLRAALEWAIEVPSPDHALRLVGALSHTGIPIGWTAIEWAQAAVMIPGAENHELFPLVAAFAALRASLQLDFEAGEALATRAIEVQARLGTHHAWVHMAPTALAHFANDAERAQLHGRAWVDAARATGDPYDLSRALILLGMTYTDDPDRAIVALDEAVRVARGAQLPSPLAYAHLGLGVVLPPEQTELAFSSLDDAIALMTDLDDQSGVASALGIKGGRAGVVGDWRTMLTASIAAIEQQHRVGSLEIARVSSFMSVAVALGHLEQPERSAMVMGYAREATSHFQSELFIEMIEANESQLREALGEVRVAELESAGAALGVADALTLVRTAALELELEP